MRLNRGGSKSDERMVLENSARLVDDNDLFKQVFANVFELTGALRIEIEDRESLQLRTNRAQELRGLVINQPAAEHSHTRDRLSGQQSVRREGSTRSSAFGADDGAFHDRFRPARLSRIQYQDCRSALDSFTEIGGKRRDPLDARNTKAIAQISRQRDDP